MAEKNTCKLCIYKEIIGELQNKKVNFTIPILPVDFKQEVNNLLGRLL